MRALPCLAVLALASTQLGGCAAAVLPLMASGAIAKRAVDTHGNDRKVIPVVTVGAGVIPPTPMPTPVAELLPDGALSAGAPEPAPETLAAAPGEDSPVPREGTGYAAMTAFVIAAMGDGKPLPGRMSALLDQRSLAALPVMETCADQRPALLMDLDPGATPFDLTDPPSPDPGLAAQLRSIRGQGVAVVWIATLPESAARDVLTIVKATGLDPLGIDRTLLLRQGETRKQQILNRAGEDWCVLAVAGDRRADFDEVFDYLRNPDGPVALALEQHIGARWFLVPLPIR
ncbi:hypothetical protein [Novosphingobium sp. CECT 9465]|uniref:hypothetical protein n=1 Tax=Novosphingobium sp. CECT 9465 TaxID=2829794 RepID=UPI001E3488CE|nr:hypothetical protein [Novosphingobium sp. CECT 9465]CAH0497714.1 hypothetical protein NVSP9465_02783 [Novosphingobium sp. CECT 9465]